MVERRVTKDSIGKLRAPATGNKVLWDSRDKGFGVRITAAGVISFVFRYVISGRERRLTIGVHKDGKGGSAVWTLVAAREEYTRLRGEVVRGHDPLEGREQERSAPTVADLADTYLDLHVRQHKRPISIKEDERMIAKFVKPKLGTKKVAAVTSNDIERFKSSLSKTPYQANRCLALLRSMFNMAIKNGERSDNPARGGRQGIQRFDEEKRDRWLSTAEIDRLLQALNGHPDQSRANIIRLLLLTGARKGEALNATWSQFDLETGVWTKPGHMTKQRRTAHTPLAAHA
ncbi:MAG: integrase family protein, partial [Proteobacteria bacterium]|nr:integrase family protein [Pseudomonadota bacterium]